MRVFRFILLTTLILSNTHSYANEQKEFSAEEIAQFQISKKVELQDIRNKNMPVLDRLANSQILEVRLLTADPNWNQMGSQFGHNLVRFVVDPKNPLEDIVIGVEGQVNDPKISILKGFIGGYEVFLNVMTYAEYLQQYYLTEHRADRESILEADTAQKKILSKFTARSTKTQQLL